MKPASSNFERRKGRLLTVNGVRWKWQVGRRDVLAYSETGTRLCESCMQVTGRDFERGQWKRTSDGMVMPSDVSAWIAQQTAR